MSYGSSLSLRLLLPVALTSILAACGSPTATPAGDQEKAPLQTQGLNIPVIVLSPLLEIHAVTHVTDREWVVTGYTNAAVGVGTVVKLQVFVNNKLAASTDPKEMSSGVDSMYYKTSAGMTGGSWFANYQEPVLSYLGWLRSYPLTVKAYDSAGHTTTVNKTVTNGVLN